MTIPMLDPRADLAELEPELTAAVQEVLASGHYVLGPQLEALEAEIASYVGVGHAVGVASGTDALALALRAAGIEPGDEVIVPDFTFIATATAVLHAGARPVFADVSQAFYTVTADAIEARVTRRTRAVIVVHLFGQTADMDAISHTCERHGLTLIEDAAQAIGADYAGRRAGAWGACGCFSFYPTKNLGACGDAGMIVTDDARLAERVRRLRHHGSSGDYRHDVLGYNSRLDEMQAAILRVKLRRLDERNARRRRHALLYQALLKDAPYRCPAEHGRGRHTYHQFTVRHPARDAVRARLQACGISTGVYYPLPLHAQPVFADRAAPVCPTSEQLAREVLTLPVYPQLEPAQIERVARELVSAAAACGAGPRA